MKPLVMLRGRAGSAVLALFALVAVASCGGSGVVGSGGTGSPLGVAVGTVNGFGSVIVDSVSYDDRGATVVAEVTPGVDVIAEVKLGHRVAVEYQSAGVASVVRIEASLAGPVASIVSPTQFSILGQTVTVNASGAAGPITQFGGGYGQALDIRSGDSIEVHGVLVRQGDVSQIQATRVDKLAAAPAYLRVTGAVSNLGAAGTATFALGALTVDASGADILPAATALANGQTVRVLARPSTLTTPSAGAWLLQAAQVRVAELRDGGLDSAVSGLVTQLDPLAKTFMFGSLRVDYSAATVSPASATLANGQYVLARGAVAADGSLSASTLTIRDTATDDEAELRGNIVGYNAATGGFSVRDVTVDTSGATLQGCPASGLANGLFVVVAGTLSDTGVVASAIQCEAEPSGAEVDRDGIASAVNIADMSFSIATENGTVVVNWTSTTYFGGVTPQTLSGKQVHAQGVLVGSVLVASKVKLDD